MHSETPGYSAAETRTRAAPEKGSDKCLMVGTQLGWDPSPNLGLFLSCVGSLPVTSSIRRHVCYSIVQRLFTSMTLSHQLPSLWSVPPPLLRRTKNGFVHFKISY